MLSKTRNFLVALCVVASHLSIAQVDIVALSLDTRSDSVLSLQPPAEASSETKGKIKPEVENKLTSRQFYFTKGNTSYLFKYSARIQTRFDSWTYTNSDLENGSTLYFRRIRFKSNGHLFTPKLEYKVEIDLLNPGVLDAILKWNFARNFSLWAGQTKLRGNRERVISSQNLELVDRSLLNSKFTLDRDIGVWLMHQTQMNQLTIRTILSVSKGEGLHILRESEEPLENGLDYTARLELLPFGEFAKKGDYSEGDLVHEPSPKFALGLSYDYNDNATKSRGHKGTVLASSADLQTWIADFMFKYRGWSWMTEYAHRQIVNVPGPTEMLPANLQEFYLGNAFNTQVGYMLPHHFEVVGRYTVVNPLFDNNKLSDYTLGLSKYIVGHKIKVQTDYSIMKEAPDVYRNVYRLQFEISL